MGINLPNWNVVEGKKDMEVVAGNAEKELDEVETKAQRVAGVEGGDPACLNDPECRAKFSRDPVSDALVDRDFVRYLNLPQRGLLAAEEANLTGGVRTL